METVVPVSGGKGSTTCAAVNPCIVYVLSSGNAPAIAFYAERGDKMEISSDSPDPLTWMVKGNELSEQWSQWRIDNLTALRSGDPKNINAAVAKYVKANSDSRLSVLLMLTSFDRRRDPSGFRKLWNSLSEDARDPALIEMAGRADVTSSKLPEVSSKFPSLVLATTRSNGYADTLRTSVGKGSIILFWHNSMNNRTAEMLTLRSLDRDFPDTTKRLMADICLDYDSVAWRMPLPGDSLKHTIRGWLPRGEADSQLTGLGIGATPCWVVTDAKGKILYIGDDSESAGKKFRAIMK